MCHFRKHLFFKNDLPQKSPVDKASPFHRGFPIKTLFTKVAFLVVPLRDLTFFIVEWYKYHMVAIGLVTPSLANGKVITYIVLVVVISTS